MRNTPSLAEQLALAVDPQGIRPTDVLPALGRVVGKSPIPDGTTTALQLMRQELGSRVSTVPVPGDIRLLSHSLDNPELVIYIVPGVEQGEAAEADLGLKPERLSRKVMGA